MKSDRNILIAFILNFFFSVFELIGGTLTNSVAIISDSIHDLGDSLSIGISFFLEKKSRKQPDENYTYGYARYSVIGSIITTLILLLGSVAVIYNATVRFFNPVEVNYDGMIIFAVVGTVINLCAAFFTKNGDSLNQKAVNLHMIEDVLGWVVVLIGAIFMRFTDISILDSVLSIIVALYIFINALKGLKDAVDLFLEKTPNNVSVKDIKTHLSNIDGIIDVHHIHIWSMDGYNNYASMHVVTEEEPQTAKAKIREELKEHNIYHVTLELETKDEKCSEEYCHSHSHSHHHHSHHHHHHHRKHHHNE